MRRSCIALLGCGWLGAVVIGAGTAAAAASVDIEPGTDIQSVVNAHPPGTTYVLKAGVHRLQAITPHPTDIFTGELDAAQRRLTTLNGAVTVTAFSQATVNGVTYWTLSGAHFGTGDPAQCLSAFPLCRRPQDVIVDNVPYLAATSLNGLAGGSYFYDDATTLVYLVNDPRGHVVEISQSPYAFTGPVSSVTIENLIVEKYATQIQMGAIGSQTPGPGWLVQNNEVRLNHGAGISLADGAQALNNYVHDNGQKGIGSVGNNVLIQGNEIAHNVDYSGTECGFECGGVKMVLANGLTVRNNFVHDNVGPGLWDDINVINALFEGNTVQDNTGGGIFHEISYHAVIRNNTLKRNGVADPWVWYGQITLSTSQNVEIASNTLVVDAATQGNGITMAEQNRQDAPTAYGPVQTTGNWIHDNTVIFLGTANGRNGQACDRDPAQGSPPCQMFNGTNRFDANHYHLANTAASAWMYDNYVQWAAWQADGQDVHGTLDANVNAAPPCQPLNFAGGSATPPAVAPGGAYTVLCDYGAPANGIAPVVGSGSCQWNTFVGTAAQYLCTAGTVPGLYANRCQVAAGTPTNACARSDAINAVQVGAPNAALVNEPAAAVRVSPNPWRADRTADRGVTFDGLARGTVIKLFTVSGHHVKTLRTDGPTLAWDLTNESGEKVGSGLYLYQVKDGKGETARGQLAIIR